MKNHSIFRNSELKKHGNKIFMLMILSVTIMLSGTIQASESSSMQQPKVTGSVIDMYSGEPIAGVTVQVKDGATVRSQEDGTYSVDVTADSKTIIFSYEGYQTLQIDIDGRTEIEVAMSVENTQEESDLWD